MLTIGTTIILEEIKAHTIERYKCKLLDQEDNLLYIDYPVNQRTRKFGIFMEGTILKASFIGKDDGFYLFDTTIIGRKKEGNIPMVVIDYPGLDNLDRLQRREFVRVETAIDVAVHPLNDEFEPFTCITSDISAGGAALILPPNHQLKEATTFQGWFVVPIGEEYHYLTLTCKVIRIISSEDVRDRAPLKFINLSDQDQHLITRLCFERQLALRKRGILE